MLSTMHVQPHLYCPILDKKKTFAPNYICKLMEDMRLLKIAKILKINALKIYDYILGSSFLMHSTQIS